MKNYFSFNQTGQKLFPIWILFYVLFLAPYFYLIFQMQHIQQGVMPPMYILPAFLILIVVAFFLQFYIFKFIIEGVVYKDKNLVFSGSPGVFLGKVVLGIVLSGITLGIYTAWFVRDVTRFFVNNTSHDSEKLEFRGTGGRLFVILLLTLIIPIIILSLLLIKFMGNMIGMGFLERCVFQMVEILILIPYMYFVYKWTVDIKFKDYIISWKTETMPSLLKLAQEIVLSLVTLYIYFPLATVRLYKYFMERTVAEGTERKLHFGYDIDQKGDFLAIWKEILLSIITLGLYYPWAICNINKRVLGKTFTETIDAI